MKKEYSKPEITFEDFSLSTNIAGDCENPTNLQSNGDCGIKFGNQVVFMDWMGACTGDDGFPVEEGGSFNGICYHTPVDTNNVFNS